MFESVDGQVFGISAIVALLLFKEAAQLVKWAVDRKSTGSGSNGLFQSAEWDVLVKQVKDLHEWHAREDDQGIKIWYVRRSFEDSIIKLNETLSASVEVLKELVREIKEDKKLLKETIETVIKAVDDRE